MQCYKPLQGWRARIPGSSGKRKIVFDKAESNGEEVILPCGQCIGCRLERSRQWAVRMMHEASLYDDNCFITLTYSPEHLPPDSSLVKKHFQDFMKRLRSRFEGRSIRYFHCGEYGEQLGRPHYHACLFGFDFPDKVFFKMAGESRLFLSPILEDIWGFGQCLIGDVTFESAAYVARYIIKKVTGDPAASHYAGSFDSQTGEVLSWREPEYVTMSRRPGLSRAWFERFGNEVYPSDEVIVRGASCKPPRYYDSLYEMVDAEDMKRIKSERLVAARSRAGDNTPERLEVKEICAEARVMRLKRSLTEGV